MDETATAFASLGERSSGNVGPPLDRIAVRDFVRSVEIGAFQSERGITQRLRFNVTLEVAPRPAAGDDDVDKVLSYDTILDAIEAVLAAERLNLLETLAERVARRCLADRRAVRAFVRVEKLDRIPGTLGVEIVRTQPPEGEVSRDIGPAAPDGPRPAVVLLSRAAQADARWRDALADWARPCVVCLEQMRAQRSAASTARRRIGLLSIEQNVWAFIDEDHRFEVAASRAELDWALKSGRRPVWAPTKMVDDALATEIPDTSDPRALAAWLARELAAGPALVAGAAALVTDGASTLGVANPDALAGMQ